MKTKKTIVDIYGKKYVVKCLGCDLKTGNFANRGIVLSTKHFIAEQDVEVPIPGFIILSSKRHLASVDELTESEQKNFITTLIKVRMAMRKVLGIKVVYLFQNEDTDSHFHVWMFPRLPWMKKFGFKIQSLRPIMEYAKKNLMTEKNLKMVQANVNKLRKHLK